MWVADMDFAVAPEIIEALQKRLNERVLGYSIIDDEWRSAYQGWWLARHDYEIQKEWLIYANGTLPAIDSIIRKLTSPAENVLLMSPVYNCFYYCIKTLPACLWRMSLSTLTAIIASIGRIYRLSSPIRRRRFLSFAIRTIRSVAPLAETILLASASCARSTA